MKKVLGLLRDAWDHLECYKSEPGIRGHGAYYAVDNAIKILETEKEKFVFPDDKHNGLSLRDYFAGQALAGIAYEYTDQYEKEAVTKIAKQAYQYADAMLARREMGESKEKEAVET